MVSLLKWLRELDLNQRPSGYEEIMHYLRGFLLVIAIYQNLSLFVVVHEFGIKFIPKFNHHYF